MTSRNDFRSLAFARSRSRLYQCCKNKRRKNQVFFSFKNIPSAGGEKNNNNAPLIKVSISLFWYGFKVFSNTKTQTLLNKATPR